jgi:hypothetical protein
MMNNSILPLCTMLACMVSVLGCIAPEGTNDETESVASIQQPAITNNAITNNAITNNAITNNAITNNAITNNAITNNAITNNAITNNAITSAALEDPNARELFKYIVSCALPATSHVDLTIDGVDYSFPGELSLAPKWGLPGGSCNTACQEWVSACILARVDYLGQKVSISVRGAQSALTPTADELANYTYREGAYYGNLFADTQVRDACIAPGRSGLPRVCGPTLDGCVVHAVDDCTRVCTGSAGFGSFMSCADHKKVNGQFPAGTRFYPTAITVFLDP